MKGDVRMDKTIKSSEQNIETPIDQKRYALVLKWSARIGLFSILFTFFIYISGLISPVIPLERLPHLWVRNSMFLNESFGIATGWGWMSLISKSDMMAKAALTFLACVPILCYLSVLPIYVKKKEIVMVFIVLMEISILILAASGLLKVE
ncbi:MAG TPA: hypothetical protein ENO30_04035 [Thermodesulfobium narugense]|nr:hypothetical protein [Thermodesulfobium narugense]